MTAAVDFLGQPLAVGDRVVYPSMSGRSAQMAAGTVVELEVWTEADVRESFGHYDDRYLARQVAELTGRPSRMKVVPETAGSRWKASYQPQEGRRPVTLTANAMSAVRVS